MRATDATGASAATSLAAELFRFRRVLLTSTRLELLKKYAGSGLGWLWIVLFPLLFLGAYMLVFMVIFRTAPAGMTSVGYVAMVFSGLVPFLALMDTMNVSVVTIKQNMHFLKNVIMPIEIITVKPVLVALVSQTFGLLLLILLVAIDGHLGPNLLLLPVVLVLEFMFLTGLAMALAPLGVLIPDLSYGISILAFLLMFVSPIAFRSQAVPPAAKFLVQFNPATYLIDAFRAAILPAQEIVTFRLAIFAVLSVVLFEGGARLLQRFKTTIVEYD